MLHLCSDCFHAYAKWKNVVLVSDGSPMLYRWVATGKICFACRIHVDISAGAFKGIDDYEFTVRIIDQEETVRTAHLRVADVIDNKWFDPIQALDSGASSAEISPNCTGRGARSRAPDYSFGGD